MSFVFLSKGISCSDAGSFFSKLALVSPLGIAVNPQDLDTLTHRGASVLQCEVWKKRTDCRCRHYTNFSNRSGINVSQR